MIRTYNIEHDMPGHKSSYITYSYCRVRRGSRSDLELGPVISGHNRSSHLKCIHFYGGLTDKVVFDNNLIKKYCRIVVDKTEFWVAFYKIVKIYVVVFNRPVKC